MWFVNWLLGLLKEEKVQPPTQRDLSKKALEMKPPRPTIVETYRLVRTKTWQTGAKQRRAF